jgi:hydrogenase maturation protein HypF
MTEVLEHAAPVALQPPLRVACAAPPVLALGAWFKNAPCLVRDSEAVFSENIGDLDSADACRRLDLAVARLRRLLPGAPAALACDLHPDFQSSRLALALGAELNVPVIAVQHHHAHIAAVVAEHGHTGPALGLALDGVGLGSDGAAWGGELLQVDGASFQRLGHLCPLPLPGGDRAAREPWRMAAAVLHQLGRADEIAVRWPNQSAAPMLAALLERTHLCPLSSSLGRYFDAAAGLLGVSEVMQFEAEAAIALERLAGDYTGSDSEQQHWRIDCAGRLDLLPLWALLADETDAARGAARFHATLVAALDAWVRHAAHASRLTTVVLSGGCFLNRILSAQLGLRLRAAGLRVLEARRLSPGDAGLALGQAWVAIHQLQQGE